MNPLSAFSHEVRRMLRERLTLLFMAVTVAITVWFCLNSSGTTAVDAYILIPSKYSAFLGALLFTLLTLVQFHRDYRNNTDNIILSYTNPIFYHLRRTLSLIGMAAITTLLSSVFTLPYALIKTGAYFQADTFFASWYLIFFGALTLSILLTSGFYMLFKRVEAAFIIMIGLIILSGLLDYHRYDLNPSYLLFWVQTNAEDFSDLVSNQFQIDTIQWNRLFCFPVALGVWIFGLSSIRRYGHGFLSSFIENSRQIWPPVSLVLTITLAGICWSAEPIFDNSIPMDLYVGKTEEVQDSGTGLFTFSFGDDEDENTELLLTDKKADVTIDTDNRTLTGEAVYSIENLTGEKQTLSLALNPGYTIKKAKVNGQEVKAIRDGVEQNNEATWYIDIPADKLTTVEVTYGGHIENNRSLSQTPWSGICREYVRIPRTCFSPSTNISAVEDLAFTWSLRLDEQLVPEFSGSLVEKLDTINGKVRWSGTENDRRNISLTAADYHTKTFEAGGLTIDFIYFAKHENEMANMDAIKVMKAAIDYFTEVYGPLVYRDHLAMLELPATFSGGYAAGNTSAMDETHFAAAGFLPGETDNPDNGSGIDTIIHEIAHQWWGLATFLKTDDHSYWSAEGVTCYSTYRFLEHYYGQAYAKERFIDVWQRNWQTYENAFYVQHPDYLAKLSKSDASNVMRNLQSIGLYNIMPLQILQAETALGGSEALMKKLSELYQNNLFGFITYEDFLSTTGLTEEVLNIAQKDNL
ncbi:MAG TPA: hypothetical protein PK466_05850 [Thermotogota bacterium]|nr:hypothetical protein [Thermotogota bacterium]HPR95832.1 hypothetical protein [Thermotogota bacterium]